MKTMAPEIWRERQGGLCPRAGFSADSAATPCSGGDTFAIYPLRSSAFYVKVDSESRCTVASQNTGTSLARRRQEQPWAANTFPALRTHLCPAGASRCRAEGPGHCRRIPRRGHRVLVLQFPICHQIDPGKAETWATLRFLEFVVKLDFYGSLSD